MIISAMVMTTTIIVTITIGVGDIIFVPLMVAVITIVSMVKEGLRVWGLGLRAS